MEQSHKLRNMGRRRAIKHSATTPTETTQNSRIGWQFAFCRPLQSAPTPMCFQFDCRCVTRHSGLPCAARAAWRRQGTSLPPNKDRFFVRGEALIGVWKNKPKDLQHYVEYFGFLDQLTAACVFVVRDSGRISQRFGRLNKQRTAR